MIIHRIDDDGTPGTVCMQIAPHVEKRVAQACLLVFCDQYPFPRGYVLHDPIRMLYQLPGEEDWITLDALVARTRPPEPPRAGTA